MTLFDSDGKVGFVHTSLCLRLGVTDSVSVEFSALDWAIMPGTEPGSIMIRALSMILIEGVFCVQPPPPLSPPPPPPPGIPGIISTPVYATVIASAV